MPSSATITAFYVFSPYNKARAIHLNSNFSIFRGHTLPISPSLGSATDQEYDLGSTDHRWRTAYISSVSLSQSVGSYNVISGTTAGGIKIVNDQTTTFSVLGNKFQGVNSTPCNPTLTAAIGSFARSAPINITITGATTDLAGSTCTITTIGRPVMVGLMNVGDTSGASGIAFTGLTLGVATPNHVHVSILSNGSTISAMNMRTGNLGVYTYTGNSVGTANTNIFYPSGSFAVVYFPAAGTYNFSIGLGTTSTTISQSRVELVNVRTFAIEL